eukprot:Gb_17604 [translate_table: standard]
MGDDLRSAVNHFNLMIQSSGMLEVRERVDLSVISFSMKVICIVLYVVWRKKDKFLSERMGGNPITMEPSVLKVDEEGEVITREKNNQVRQLTKFIKDDETFYYLDSRIVRESLPKPWDRVAIQIMKYLMLEGPIRGGFSILSGTSVSKAQLLLRLTPISPMPKFGETISYSKEDFISQGDNTPLAGTKEGGGRKRKPPPQTLNASLAKCSQRSTRLEKKTVDKAKIMDFVDSLEEDHTMSNISKNMEGGFSFKMMGIDPLEKGLVKGPNGTQTLVEELKCHLKVLNGLGGSLSSTCTCINLLTLEIIDYMKDIVKNLKDLSVKKEQ